MIKFLHIRNLATIEDIELSFAEGFSILTGETGAGKSIIIDSIRLLLGEKSSADLIRTGKTEATVEAIFSFGPSAVPPGLESLAQDGEITLNRQIVDQGSGKAYAGGVLVPVKKLKEWSPLLVDIYGQNDHVFLLHLENHLNYVDHFGETMALREDVAGLAQALRKLLREKKDLEARQRDAAQRLDFLEYQIKEIEGASLKPEEEEELHKERHVLKHAEKVAGLVESALDLAYNQEQSLTALARRLEHVLAELSTYDPAFQAMGQRLEEISITLGELADSLIRYQEKQASPDRLEAVEERLSLIEKLKRKYGNDIRDICYYYDRIRAERDSLAHSQERLESLTREIDTTVAAYMSKATDLSRRRARAGQALQDQIEKEIGLLGMKKARFAVQVVTSTADSTDIDKVRDTGLDDLEFLISPNPGEQLKPLRKIASGGELSRVMLALKAVGKEKETLKTLVFDEIDAGIGGKTAEFIAHKLKELSRRHQIVCITHLPQIASFAAQHYRIEKRIENNRTFTTVAKLDFEERVEEIARLISGSHVTAASLQHAREMLNHNLSES
jgi:DNA repair protein RecN (Recombination protein N)